MVSVLRRSTSPLILLLSLVFVGELVSLSSADDFRISTKIYRGKKEDTKAQLLSETTTLFRGGVVYDFLADGSQIAVFRKLRDQPGRFILLNPDERIRTEFSTDQLSGLTDHLREWAAKQPDPMLKFAANPQFEESFDSATSKLILASHMQTYTVTTEPAGHPEAIAEYREFLNWYTQLKQTHGGPPEEPRMKLNEALARRRVVPRTVELALKGEKEPLRAEHEFTWRVSRQDEDQIEEVLASLASFREVGNDEFKKAAKPKPAGK